ncbi:uncharacterized protein LOC120724553 isoform X2 [Simochromis diagramma]|uniref:uncharacterized protein LOC120724553 isoform X2 n=1 Tax=Simochromis diagramma TaxID=43689 RepID=UPI001A7E7DEC|nr:uncharacterized protein LOC120724553 isoform X2 [Simochromis diagramma]
MLLNSEFQSGMVASGWASDVKSVDPSAVVTPCQISATHIQLIQGAQEASGGQVTGRFFHLHPRRRVRLVPWLARWIRKGAVPVATMNMQLAVPEGEEVPDAWHHQLIFGVTSNAVFMTNPLDVVSEGEVHQRLCSESMLLIRREDVLQRLTPDCSLSGLSESQSDPRWKALDVEGQVRQMATEEEGEEEEENNQPKMTHIRIPAAYSSGVTLFAIRESELGQELLDAPELPLL